MASSTRRASKSKKASRSKSTKRTPQVRTGAARGEFVKVRFSKQVAASLGEIQTLPAFLSATGTLTPRARTTIVDQALVMIDQTYVHLPLKRAMHAIDPVQSLRLVKQRLNTYSERAFHNEMISIFVRLRDLHTNYILPEPYSNGVAFLPFHVEEYFEGTGAQERSVFIVTEVSGTLSDPNFKPGIIITHWNGIPMATAVEINADREAGSNLDARHLQGLETLTNRWMGMSLPPAEDWVVVNYLPGNGRGPSREARFAWQVSLPPDESEGDGSVLGVVKRSGARASQARIGIDAKGEMQRRFRKLLFAPDAVSSQRKMTNFGARAPEASRAFYQAMKKDSWEVARSDDERPRAPSLDVARQKLAPKASLRAARQSGLPAAAILDGVDLTSHSIMPDVIKNFGSVASPKGNFGYIRLVTFDVEDIDAFIGEFVRILTLLPQQGLILDVRGNGGGYIEAGERLLQTLTPKEIEPERFHLINTPLTLRMCQQKDGELVDWKASAEESVEIGAAFTQGFPLTSREACNDIGQIYQGPVVLVIDAGCYSTTDMFAAGFQDHELGHVLGTSGHTGAGGANVWEHSDLVQTLPREDSPFKPIRSGASFRVAIRRSTRVGLRSGEPLEDLGVVPDGEVYRMTRNDVLNHNADMIAHACGILAKMPRQRLAATSQAQPDGSLSLTLVTDNIQRVDVWLDSRPVHTMNVKNGSISLGLPGAAATTGILECRGFRDSKLVARIRPAL
jgi:C-terminal processing protease CtpA/Prc